MKLKTLIEGYGQREDEWGPGEKKLALELIGKRNKQIKKEEKLKFQVEYHEEVDDEDKQIEEEIKRLRNIVLNNK